MPGFGRVVNSASGILHSWLPMNLQSRNTPEVPDVLSHQDKVVVEVGHNSTGGRMETFLLASLSLRNLSTSTTSFQLPKDERNA
jgi:hypothetical protein